MITNIQHNTKLTMISIYDPRNLAVSSFFFMIPGMCAYYSQQYFFFGMLLATSCISANYWRDPVHGCRRNADLFFAKIAFTVFAYNGAVYVRYVPYMVVGYTELCGVCYCYYMSEKLCGEKDRRWVLWHGGFHILMTHVLHMIIGGW